MRNRRRSRMTGREPQNHWQWLELTAKGVERQAQGFEGQSAEKPAVARFAEDHVSAADPLTIPEQSDSLSTGYFTAIGEPEFLSAERSNTEPSENRCWNDRVNCAGIDQQFERLGPVRSRRITNLKLQQCKSHDAPWERATGLQPAMSSLGSRHSAVWLRPLCREV